MIVLDTSGVIALADQTDTNHTIALQFAQSPTEMMVVPAGIMAEIAYMLMNRAGERSVVRFIDSIVGGSILWDSGEQDLPRVRTLMLRYADLPLAAIVYTNIANDGMLRGIDPGTLNDLAGLARLGLRVIASGGVTTLDDVRNLVHLGRNGAPLAGAIVGRSLYEGTLRLVDAIRVAAEM